MEHLPKVTRQALLLSGLSQVVARSEPADAIISVQSTEPAYDLLPVRLLRTSHCDISKQKKNDFEQDLGPSWFPVPGHRYISRNCLNDCDPSEALVELCLGEGDVFELYSFLSAFYDLHSSHALHAATYQIPCRDRLNDVSHLLWDEYILPSTLTRIIELRSNFCLGHPKENDAQFGKHDILFLGLVS